MEWPLNFKKIEARLLLYVAQTVKSRMSIEAKHLPPMSSAYMRGLKAKTDKENDILRAIKINNIVVEIYKRAEQYAATHEERYYEWNINNGDSTTPFNIPYIIEGLEPLFPDCLVEHRMIVETVDGKKYEISNMGEDELSKLRINNQREVIAIDWS
jgi:hypothetical protein